MRLAIETIAYKEDRFLPKFIQHYQNKVEEILILNSTVPWLGEADDTPDKTGNIGRSLGATIIEYAWADETSQRNAGLDYLSDYDWVIIVDPDEFISDEDWNKLLVCLEIGDAPAYNVAHQRVFWKHMEIFPHTDYQQLIAVRPQVRFVDKRVINSGYGVAPVDLLHFSWARTDEEVLRKITHYSHANEMVPNWYEDVWLADKKTNLHPKDPEVLSALIPAVLPPEIEKLDLWP